MLPSVPQKTSASRIGRISGLITFTLRLWPSIPSPRLHNSPLPGWVRGSVLRWWLAFPQAGFSPAGEYGFISALLWFLPRVIEHVLLLLYCSVSAKHVLFKKPQNPSESGKFYQPSSYQMNAGDAYAGHTSKGIRS